MPTFSQGSRSNLSYIAETTFGTTPSGNFKNIPLTSHSLNLTKDRVTGSDIKADRMSRVDRHGNRSVSGDIVVDLRDSDYDDLIAAAMLSSWSTAPTPDVIKVGTTPKFFTFEDRAADIGQSRLFTGCTVNSMSVSLAPNQMVTTTFGIVGKDMSITTSAKTLNFASGAQPFDSYSGDISIGDVASASATGIVTGLDFSITNSFAPTFVIGDSTAPSLEYGMAVVEGSFTAYFEDASLINRFLDEVESELSVSVNDPTGLNEYIFTFPRIKLNAADVPLSGPTSRLITVPFVALYDTTEATNLKIERPDVS